ncbi:unnamed protein product [Pleuronectes platessa]|uniref:Uncharacterized protein n=1 Tax=Pleuronectes platessa TaxID=8262 RepID=A0A9N7Z8U9_PLEPL|nr:unnamed protein product [Pleuronectes platessa]
MLPVSSHGAKESRATTSDPCCARGRYAHAELRAINSEVIANEDPCLDVRAQLRLWNVDGSCAPRGVSTTSSPCVMLELRHQEALQPGHTGGQESVSRPWDGSDQRVSSVYLLLLNLCQLPHNGSLGWEEVTV